MTGLAALIQIGIAGTAVITVGAVIPATACIADAGHRWRSSGFARYGRLRHGPLASGESRRWRLQALDTERHSLSARCRTGFLAIEPIFLSAVARVCESATGKLSAKHQPNPNQAPFHFCIRSRKSMSVMDSR